MMKELGATRSAWRADHLLHTADTFVRAPLPGMRNATAIVHIAPAAGAKFTQYTAEFSEGGELGHSPQSRFLYVMDGELSVGDTILTADSYAYLPPGDTTKVHATAPARASVIEKEYVPLAGHHPPARFISSESHAPSSQLMGDPWLEVRTLIPADPAFDFAVNTMTYQPGAALPMVEIHVMEHGLVMLAGGGIYRLGDSWYPTTAGDFIWMAPYCPQWFGALGKTPAKYLIYKDWNR
jgi:(S)-ureidoglycine aminohydrolase